MTPPILLEPGHLVAAPGGAALATDVHRPADDGPHPCLLQRVPYGRAVSGIANGALEVRRAVDAGYVVVVQDCRGRGGSTGRFEPFTHEVADAAATLDWLVEQPFCDGRVATIGRSYAGYTQWAAASTGHPALRAIAPMISGADVPGGWLRPDGVLEWGFATWWTLRYLAPGLVDAELWDEILDRAARPHELLRDAMLDDPRVVAAVPFLSAWVDDRVEVESIRPTTVPALVVAGWFDVFARSCLDTFRSITGMSITGASNGPAADHRLVVGPWAHGGALQATYPDWTGGPRADAASIDLTGRQLEWFARWMPVDPDVAPADDAVRPRIQAFVGGADRWIEMDQWPPEADPHRIDGNRFDVEAPAPDAAGYPLPVDVDAPFPTRGGPTFLPGLEAAALAGPREQGALLGRSDAVVLSHRPDHPIEVVGDVTAQVRVDVGGARVVPGSVPLLCVRLCERRPDGSVIALAEGAAPLPTSDGVHEVSVRVGPLGWRFDPSSEVIVLVTRASYPRFRAPHAAEDDWSVHLLADERTWLELPGRPTADPRPTATGGTP